MDKKKLLVVIMSVVVSLAVVGGALVYAIQKRKTLDAPIEQPHTVSQAELKAADGKNGHPCLIAVDGTVYQIRGFSQWQNGKHANSDGLAYCAADMSAVIDKAPHGRSVLSMLIKVGPLK